MNKQPDVTEKTRSTFINVFCSLYQQKPIEKISIQEITKMAGYNRSTFYQYFTDIYDLLEYIENDVLEYMRNSEPKNLNDSQLNHMFIQNIASLYEKKGAYLSALLGDYGSVRFGEKLKNEMVKKMKNINLILNEDLYMPYVVECSLSMIVAAFRHWQRSGKNITSDDLARFISSVLSEGTITYAKRYLQELNKQ
ncbi:TetR/AcrR family transcriptional regulator [Ruminococcus sp. OA3]|uniref:TetR/AcrR family transcriptional regulator n=1 Tax=Ruminococcus sp. OA3 TaxID=2914164 RepID=UPI001F069756|nr:TetR/AcrR family transcriptional regulator [Ruminococcus sp. OA3]MCH1982239.1 TetR/AcrR family transcriptional regulator [Ruminococcus sp. OA3]